ncbi:septum formation initiator family protein [Microbacterium sp. CFBP9023]|uniref:FtsB family cell division protein n=1 Tax=unclassified Microbacterium TaxID=2609290 RepID=UPI0009FB22CA|nr:MULTISPECIES: septum formation initiator family protein [unclassified Microbacterium]MDY0985624.1 septum formation initiator family protein [Microbacterium sp. CFBP9023]
MARRPAPPSASPGATRPASAPPSPAQRTAGRTPRGAASRGAQDRRVDVREWASGIRLSAFSVIMLSLVVLGAWVLVPTLGTFIDQRQKISALEQSIQVSEDQIAALEKERERWNDPAYITTQARERLYYVKPGEVVYLIDNDLDPAALPQQQGPVSDTLEETPSDWMPQLLRTLTSAGLSDTAAVAR